MRAISTILSGMVVITLSTIAQEREPTTYFGPLLSAGAGLDWSSLNVYKGSPDCGTYNSGKAVLFGGGVRAVFLKFFGESIDLQAGLQAGLASATLTAEPVDPTRIVEGDKLVELDRQYQLKASQRMINADIEARFRLSDRLVLGIGPRISYRLSASYEALDVVLGPGDYSFADGQHQRTLLNGEIPTNAALGLGPLASIGYEVPFARTALLVPSLRLSADLLSNVKGGSWNRATIEGAVALLFDITPAPAPPPPPPPPPPDTVKPVVVVARERPRLSASIAISGIDDKGNPLPVTTVHVNEVLMRRNAPLLAAVFFDRDSVTLPDRYTQIDRAAADSFATDDLASLGVLDVQHRVLDILGSRMRKLPSSHLTLVGSVSRDEAPARGRARAATVRQYLESVWGIEPSRISVQDGSGQMQRSNEATEDGRADNRRVEFLSNSDDLLAPAVTEQVERDFDPPLVRMAPSYVAEAGLKHWQLTVTQSNKVVAQYRGTDSAGLYSPELTWHLPSPEMDTVLVPLGVELQVEDSTGATAVARSGIPLTMERRVSVIDGRVVRDGDREQISFTLVGFDYNAADLGRQHESAMNEIANAVRPGARITITGYTDRIGEEQRNVALSAQRAERVAAAVRARLQERKIKGVNVTASGGGIETERFPNDLPEGRVLSRGVHVVVEQTADAANR